MTTATLATTVIPAQREPLRAWRAEFHAPVASFRDPLFPGLSRGLPLPSPSTVRGLLAAATGADAERLPFGMAAWAAGGGVDAETYHPINADGSNPAVAGRVRAGKGGMTLRERPFLADVQLTLWLPGPEGGRVAQALRRPCWPLRLGRSQDVVHLTALREVTLEPAAEAVVGRALAPAGGHDVGSARLYRMAASVSVDRLVTSWGDYLWCDLTAGRSRLRGAYREAPSAEEQDQAVWLLDP
ncbi:CRISPR-associated protein Cas5 [Streptomyces hainanensis]|uniref:CRISPR-associated protein Cas5 n=1 Tax=Streptomyces hainanensis TaxID=402648 RepID=A0A4R4TUM1_9ACTN|nr:CRISPR-associated protein Cas5 [Streptomyces hainanensis]TDC80516.1 CRISPR-associated protein Cas5 [Streptomyces hainanensis]